MGRQVEAGDAVAKEFETTFLAFNSFEVKVSLEVRCSRLSNLTTDDDTDHFSRFQGQALIVQECRLYLIVVVCCVVIKREDPMVVLPFVVESGFRCFNNRARSGTA